jgi:hypothetical protein
MGEEAVLALQRTLVDAALMADPGPLERDPGGLAAAHGLPRGDQAALVRFRPRLMVYRNMVRSDLIEPVETTCCVTRALMEGAGLWDECLTAFLASRTLQSPFYRDLPAAFLGWLVATGWGQDRWPFLLQLVHCELLSSLVTHHPGGDPLEPSHAQPRLGDRLVLAAPTQVVTYGYQVHRVSRDAPVPAPGAVHLMAYRNGAGVAQWMELTPATAALLLAAQRTGIGQAALDLGLTDLSEAIELLADFQARGAIGGFT